MLEVRNNLKNLLNFWQKGFFESTKRNPQKEVDISNNRSYYNKYRKEHLEHTGKIRCSRCGYNKGENSNYETVKSWKFYRHFQYRCSQHKFSSVKGDL